MSYNPFAARLAKAEEKLSKLEAQRDRLNANALPGSFVTGRSGRKASYMKRVDRQLDRTIDLASATIKARQDVAWLKAKVAAYDAGTINWQGRRIDPNRKPKASRPVSEKRKLRARAFQDLSIDGRCEIDGTTVDVLHGWSEEERTLIGVIRVTTKAGKVTDHRANSPQGMHLEETYSKIVDKLLGIKPAKPKRPSGPRRLFIGGYPEGYVYCEVIVNTDTYLDAAFLRYRDLELFWRRDDIDPAIKAEIEAHVAAKREEARNEHD